MIEVRTSKKDPTSSCSDHKTNKRPPSHLGHQRPRLPFQHTLCLRRCNEECLDVALSGVFGVCPGQMKYCVTDTVTVTLMVY